MNPTTGYYFLIQYCPDASRDEAANVGVVLFCPEPLFLKARTAQGNDRIRRFFRPLEPDWARINVMKQSIERRLTIDRDQFRDLASLERFAATLANSMRLTKPRAIAVEDPEKDLNSLFEQLVGGRARREQTRVRNLLDRSLNVPGLASLVRRNLAVTLPIFQRQVKIPYGFQNGRFHLIQATSFKGLSTGGILQRAGQFAVEGELFYRHDDPDLGPTKLVVVGEFGSDQDSIASAVREVLQANQADLYTTQEVSKLVEWIHSTAKPF